MKYIQVVEDEPSIARFLAAGLTYKGFTVSVASTGTQALEQVAALTPDAVLLDVMLPDLDGFEVCRRLRASHAHLPILILTARTPRLKKWLDSPVGPMSILPNPLTLRSSWLACAPTYNEKHTRTRFPGMKNI